MLSSYINLIFIFIVLVCSIVFINNYAIDINIFGVLSTFFVIIILLITNRYKELNNPAYLFILGWLLPLGLSQIRFSQFQVDFSNKTNILIILSTIAFLVPMIFSNILLKVKNSYNRYICKYDIDKLYKPIIIIFVIGFIFVILNWVLLGGIPLFAGEYKIGHLEKVKGFAYFTTLLFPNSALVVIYLISSKKKRFRKLMYFILIFPIIYSFLQTTRSILFSMIYYELFACMIGLKINGYNMKSIKKFIKKVFIPIIIFFLFFMTYVGNIRLASNDNVWSTFLKFSLKNENFAWIYSYYVMNFDNLNYFINHFSNNWFYGYNVLMPIIGPTQLKSLWVNNISINYPTLWNGATGTYIMKIYADGGLVYTIIIVFLLSLIYNFTYLKYLGKENNLKCYFVYLIFSFGILSMFFDAGAFFDPTVFINAFIFYKVIKNTEQIIVNTR